MFSRGLYFLLCSLIFQFDAVAQTSFFKVSSFVDELAFAREGAGDKTVD